MRFSSSFKVGLLTILAIVILVLTVLWVKGRAISNGERITVSFKDINGLRAGSGVQMMGVRVGQVETLTPKINGIDSYVDVKFVITEPNVKIPKASNISIQQTGVIGELFIEITPPPIKTIYLPVLDKNKILRENDEVIMSFKGENKKIGIIKNAEIIDKEMVPILSATDIHSKYAYKIDYIIDVPNLILPKLLKGSIVSENGNKKLKIKSMDNIEVKYPTGNSKYTIVEPMRISDFLDLQYRSAMALAETNERLATLLSDDVIVDLKKTIQNFETLTQNANTAIDKTTELIDLSKEEMLVLSEQINELSVKINKMADNILKITEDKEFTESFTGMIKNINKLSGNINKLIEDPDTKQLINDIETTAKNISEISSYVNDITKDEQLKAQLNNTITKLNSSLDKLNIALDTVNYVTEDERDNLKQSIKEVEETTTNVKKFSEKLNKRFLLFRLLF